MPKRKAEWLDATELERLVRAAQRDDPSALEALLGALRPALVRFFAKRLTTDRAEDLAQNALGRIARARMRIDPERADAYVTTVALNLLRTESRRRRMELERSSELPGDELEAKTELPDRRAEYEELVRAVHRVIEESMPLPLAEIMRGVMRGDSPSEIADRHGVNPITVRTRLMRARAILRAQLGAFLEHDERKGA